MRNIVLFGCWNKGNCKPGKPEDLNAFGKVAAAIKKEETPEFLVVLGDNFYPEKKKDSKGNKIKYFTDEHYRSGLECLHSIGKPVHLLLGNHDLENPTQDTGFEPGHEDCHITDIQKKFSESKGFFDIQTRCRLWKNTLLVFINSMFYTKDDKESVHCYLQHYGSSDVTDLSTIITQEKNAILSSIRETFCRGDIVKNVIICGHHPYVARKRKEGKERIIFNERGKELFLEIKKTIFSIMCPPTSLPALPTVFSPDEFSKENILFYYCCADVHNFQQEQILITDEETQLTFEQIVIGTGGAELDDCPDFTPDMTLPPPERTVRLPERDVTFPNAKIRTISQFAKRCHKEHGYVVCQQNETGELTFVFKGISESKGGARKRNRKTKKNHRKKRKSFKKKKNRGKNKKTQKSVNKKKN